MWFAERALAVKKANTKVTVVLCLWLGEGDASLALFHRSQRLQCLCRTQPCADRRGFVFLRTFRCVLSSGCVLKVFLLDLLGRPWRLLRVGLLESWRRQRYAVDYIRPPIQLGALLLALFWLHMDGDTSCGPHLCVFILSVILALFYASAATQESEKE